jgi:hypothetical protein
MKLLFPLHSEELAASLLLAALYMYTPWEAEG